MILTKSVSRFARNVVDCISYTRKLASLRNPVGVFFEIEHLFTLNDDCELSLSFIATLAQQESHAKSKSMNFSYEMRFRRGLFLTPSLLGYDLNKKSELVINEDESLTVRLIFFMYLYGYSCQQIADTLTRLGRLTKKGNRTWSSGTVLGILQNERHCGDVLAHKTWTPNYLDHKSRKNVNNRNQYRRKDHHEPIISRDDFIATQRLIASAKYGYKGVLPTLHVMEEGSLRGFVVANTRWAGFSIEDYLDASRNIAPIIDEKSNYSHAATPNDGDFDLRGYELVRAEFLGSFQKDYVTFSRERLVFSAHCIQKLARTSHVEILLHPHDHLMAIRPTTKDNRNAVQWAKIMGDRYLPRDINTSVFLNLLFELMRWDTSCKYRVRGVCKQNETGCLVMFDLQAIEAIIPLVAIESDRKNANPSPAPLPDGIVPLSMHSKKSVIAFPVSWSETFGDGLYQEKAGMDDKGTGDIQQHGKPFHRDGETLAPTSGVELSQHITSLIDTMEQEGKAGES